VLEGRVLQALDQMVQTACFRLSQLQAADMVVDTALVVHLALPAALQEVLAVVVHISLLAVQELAVKVLLVALTHLLLLLAVVGVEQVLSAQIL
jgi:hypothetical protein